MLGSSLQNAKGSYHGFRRALVRFRLKSFRPKVIINEKVGSYQIKTAETEEELEQVLRLRAEVFFEEKGFSGGKSFGLDFDKYDLKGDHILLKDLKSGRTIATYRMISNLFSDQFYSESEFDMTSLLAEDCCKLELGRACIDKDFRNGVSLNLIWKGIGAYIMNIGASYVFGCTSIYSTNRMVAEKLSAHFFNESFVEEEFSISATKKYQFKLKDYQPIPVDLNVEDYVPALMSSYLKAGAKVVASPALDRKFGCIDYLTVLKVAEMNEKYKKRYLGGSHD